MAQTSPFPKKLFAVHDALRDIRDSIGNRPNATEDELQDIYSMLNDAQPVSASECSQKDMIRFMSHRSPKKFRDYMSTSKLQPLVLWTGAKDIMRYFDLQNHIIVKWNNKDSYYDVWPQTRPQPKPRNAKARRGPVSRPSKRPARPGQRGQPKATPRQIKTKGPHCLVDSIADALGFSVDEEDFPSLTGDGNPVVNWGDAEELETKNSLLADPAAVDPVAADPAAADPAAADPVDLADNELLSVIE